MFYVLMVVVLPLVAFIGCLLPFRRVIRDSWCFFVILGVLTIWFLSRLFNGSNTIIQKRLRCLMTKITQRSIRPEHALGGTLFVINHSSSSIVALQDSPQRWTIRQVGIKQLSSVAYWIIIQFWHYFSVGTRSRWPESPNM